MSPGHLATVLPFRDAMLRPPGEHLRTETARPRTAGDGLQAANVVVLAGYARSSRRRRRDPFTWLPPDGGQAA